MRIVEHHELPALVEELRRFLPESITVFMLARNACERDGRHAWPTVQFVTDQFPNLKVCIVRPDPESSNQVPRQTFPAINLYATDQNALDQFLTHDDVLNWKRPLHFLAVPNHLVSKIYELIDRRGSGYGSREREDFVAFPVVFKPDSLTSCPELPDGFTIRELTRSEVVEVNSVWHFGKTPECLRYFLYLHEKGFPTVGIFDKEGRRVAHGLTAADMDLIAAFVEPEHRNKKLFHIMTNFICKRQFEMGLDFVYAFVSEQNIPSQKSMIRAGGQLLKDCLLHWIVYIPNGYDDPNDPLIAFTKTMSPSKVWDT